MPLNLPDNHHGMEIGPRCWWGCHLPQLFQALQRQPLTTGRIRLRLFPFLIRLLRRRSRFVTMVPKRPRPRNPAPIFLGSCTSKYPPVIPSPLVSPIICFWPENNTAFYHIRPVVRQGHRSCSLHKMKSKNYESGVSLESASSLWW